MKQYQIAAVILTLAALLGGSASAQLLHRYDFETAASANDTVGTAHGTLYGAATVSGGALKTTGVSGTLFGGVPQNCAGLPASAVAGITNAFSIEVWYLANYNGGYYCTLFSFSSNNTANYVLATPARGVSPYQSDVAVKGGGGSAAEQLANQFPCDTGVLHNLLVTYDGTNVTYYLEGTLQTYAGLQNSFTSVGLVLSNLTYIGIAGGAPYADNTINGKVFDFRIYGQALTAAQVWAVYDLGANASNATISTALANPSAFAWNGVGAEPFYGDYWTHDPSRLVKQGNTYNVFMTGQNIVRKTSPNLRDWTDGGVVFPSGPPAWTTNEVPGFTGFFWAPDVVLVNGTYYLYYAASGNYGAQISAIGLATATNLAGPWTDQGRVIQSAAAIPTTALIPARWWTWTARCGWPSALTGTAST